MMKREFSSDFLKERYVRLEHSTGLPIYVFPKKMSTTCAYFAVRYGSQDCEFETENGAPVRDEWFIEVEV